MCDRAAVGVRGRYVRPPSAACCPDLEVLLELGLVLTGQVLMLLLELADEQLFLDLLLLLNEQQLLLQLPLPQARVRAWPQHPRVCAQVQRGHGFDSRRYLRLDVHCETDGEREKWGGGREGC